MQLDHTIDSNVIEKPAHQLRSRCKLFCQLLLGRGLFRRTSAIFLFIATVLLFYSEAGGVMHVSASHHFIFRKSFLYYALGGTVDNRDFGAAHGIKFPTGSVVMSIWRRPEEQMGLSLTNIYFRPYPKKSRFGVPWVDYFQGMGSFLVPLGWLYVLPILVFVVTLRRTLAIDISAPRCAACGYNLTGLTNGRCPECGTPVSEAQPERA